MSRMRCVGLVTNASIAPLVPAGTIAAFEVCAPSCAFSVETSGWVCPVGHVVRYDSGPCGTTVKFSDRASAPEGMEQTFEVGMARVWPPSIVGPPFGPGAFLVSLIRHGESG